MANGLSVMQLVPFFYAAALSPCPVPTASHAANRKQLYACTLLGYISKFT